MGQVPRQGSSSRKVCSREKSHHCPVKALFTRCIPAPQFSCFISHVKKFTYLPKSMTFWVLFHFRNAVPGKLIGLNLGESFVFIWDFPASSCTKFCDMQSLETWARILKGIFYCNLSCNCILIQFWCYGQFECVSFISSHSWHFSQCLAHSWPSVGPQ